MTTSATMRLSTPVQAVRVIASPDAPAGDGSPAADAQAPAEQAQAQVQAREAELAQAVAAVQAAASELAGLRERIVAEAEGQLVELALEIARRVLMQEVRAGRHEIDPIVREVLARVPGRGEVTVRLNPDDLARSELAAGDGQAVFQADPSVRPGECRVETAEGAVVSEIEAGLGEIADGLREAAASPEQSPAPEEPPSSEQTPPQEPTE